MALNGFKFLSLANLPQFSPISPQCPTCSLRTIPTKPNFDPQQNELAARSQKALKYDSNWTI